jgi:hypothetical protein
MEHVFRHKFHFAAYLTQFVCRIFNTVCLAHLFLLRCIFGLENSPPPARHVVVMMLSLDCGQPGERDGGLQRDERPGIRVHVHPGRSGGRSILPQEEGPRHRQPHNSFFLAREYWSIDRGPVFLAVSTLFPLSRQ